MCYLGVRHRPWQQDQPALSCGAPPRARARAAAASRLRHALALQYPTLLGRGAWKRVYKAFDQEEGLEVAWNQVELRGNHLDQPEQRERLFAEIR